MQTKSSRKQRSYNDIIKIDFKIRGVTRDTEEFHMIIVNFIINVDVPHSKASQFREQ
jgi:hypothetical protein